ncbi:MAG: zinc ABC transporter substrate-binding protein [Clostridia bacterium]|nr:zinc ABC transporter substrate-binding protein [Clostridia bacterium]
MKKIISFLVVFILLLSCLTGIGLAEEKKISVVTTIFAIYDWVREIAGEDLDGIDLTMLLDSGVDLHSYQPTAPDMLKVAATDLFIYVGGESDAWAENVLRAAANPDMRVISLVEALGDDVKIEEEVEGMEPEAEEDEEEEEIDEHVWLSLRNAEKLTRVITDTLSEIDPEHAAAYQANASAYIAQLSALDAEYTRATDTAEYKTLLFGDRFPFRYLMDDYGLNYYAAFSGCSAETEASFQTVVFLADKVDELGLPAVMTIEGTNHKIAETVVNATKSQDARVLTLDSLQSTTREAVEQGATYLGIMESNLKVLEEALNR